MHINLERKLSFSDVNFTPRPTEIPTRKIVNLEVSYICKHSKARFAGVPIVVANMDTTATIAMAQALSEYKMWVALHKFIPSKDLIEHFHNDGSQCSFMTIGMGDDEIQRLSDIQEHCRPIPICIDVANGYMYHFLDHIKKVRERFPNSIIMAGNVCTPEGVENIIKAGADIAKCGIASGSCCSTKDTAGVAYKQFSVALECGEAANSLNALCCSDGGVRVPADFAKALGAGSHLVMAGGIFGGYQECDAQWKEVNGRKQMLMYGMSSKIANEKYCGGLQSYRAAEGIENWIDCKGSVKELALQIRGSLASVCSYSNVKNLENLSKNASFNLN